jgi:hypothetical protein
MVRVEPQTQLKPAPPAPDDTGLSPYFRAPLAPSQQMEPDTLGQFLRKGYQQNRHSPLPSSANVGSNAATNSTVAGAVRTVTSSSLPASLTQSIFTTNGLANGAQTTGTVSMAGTFVLVFVNLSAPGRLRLYSTGAAQATDASRPTSVPPTPGLANCVISDHFLIGSPGVPLNFQCSPPIIGANQDAGQSNTVYWTVTNNSGSTVQMTVKLTYLQMEAIK